MIPRELFSCLGIWYDKITDILISVRELQVMLGFATPQAIYKWQRGETLPTVENLAALAYILGVAVEDILVVKCYRE